MWPLPSQVTWLEYLIHTGEERDQLYLSSAYLLSLNISTLKSKPCEPGLHLNPSTAGQLSPLCISLTVKSLCEVLRLVHMFCLVQVNVSQECRPGQRCLDQRCLWATSSNQPPTGLTEWNYRDGWLVINCCFKIGIKSRQGHTFLESTKKLITWS